MPSVQISRPGAGEKLYVGTTYLIRWSSSGASNQRLQYSLDNGATFTPIQTGLGSQIQQFSWVIPSGIISDGQNSIPAIVRVVVRDASGNEATAGNNVTISNAEVTSITPNRGPVTGNTPVDIVGQGFAPNCNVKFGNLDGAITQSTPTSIKVNTPAAMAAGTVDVKVKNPNVPGVTVTGGFTYDLPEDSPRIDRIEPIEGPATRSISVVITGANFVRNSTVRFASVNARSVSFDNPGQLTVQTPEAMMPGLARVRVVNPDQRSATREDGFKFNGPPVVSRVDPPEGPRDGGISVSVQGQNFRPGATVRFGNTLAPGTPAVNADGTGITCTLPPGQKGAVAVTVQNPAPDLQSGSRDLAFTYLGPKQEVAARIFSIAPKTVLLDTETMMKVKGRNLKTAIEQGVFAVRGPNQDFATIKMRGLKVEQPPGTQEDIVTFFLTISRPAGLSLAQRVPYYVVASVRPKARADRIFETSRNGQFTLVTNSSPLAFGVTAQLIEGAANMILLSGRNLKGSSVALADRSGKPLPVSFVNDREDLLIAGLTLDDSTPQGTAGAVTLTLLGPNQKPVGAPIPLEVMPGGPSDGDNDVPVARLKPAPGQQVVTMPQGSAGLFAFASGGDGGAWLPGDPIFPLPDVAYVPELLNIAQFAIELVSESLVVPAFGRTNKARVGVFRRVRAVPLVIHLEITLFVVVRVFVFRKGNPFPNAPIGEFNEFASEFPDAFGTYLAFVTTTSLDLNASFLIALVRPDDQIVILLVAGIDFQLTQQDRRLIIRGRVVLGAHIRSIRPLTGAANLLLAAPATGTPPISDPASFLGFFFPTQQGRGCIDWEFKFQFTNTFLDGTPVNPDENESEFVVRVCTEVNPFPGELLKLQIDPPSLLLKSGESAAVTAVDMNGRPSPVPVRFELDAPAQSVAALGPQTATSNSVTLTARRDVEGGGRIRALASTPPGFGLSPSLITAFSFAAATGVSAEIDSASLNVGADRALVIIASPGEGQRLYCDEPIFCKAVAKKGQADVSNRVKWEALHQEVVNLCEFRFGSNSYLVFEEAAAEPQYRIRPRDVSNREGEGFSVDIRASLPGTNADPAVVSIKCKDSDGRLLCRAWENRPKIGAVAQLTQIIAVEGLDLGPTERRQLGYAAANIWRYGRCFRFPYANGFRKPMSLEDGIRSIQDFERTNKDPKTRKRFERFDPNIGSGPINCTECVDYADAVAAAKEIVDDKRSDGEFAVRFKNGSGRPSHAIAFDQAGERNPQQPNAEAIFLRGQGLDDGFVSCHTFRRLKPFVKVQQPAANSVHKTCGPLAVQWQGGGSNQRAEILVNGEVFDLIGFSNPCADATSLSYRIPPTIVPRGQKQVNAIVRVTVDNRCVEPDSEVNDEVRQDVPITIVAPPLSVTVSTPARGQRVNLGATLRITWRSAGSSQQDVLVSFDGGSTFKPITLFPLDCDVAQFEWVVAALVPEGQKEVPAIIRVSVTNVSDLVQNDDRPIIIVVQGRNRRPGGGPRPPVLID
jgi:hypothetical protein